MVHNRHIDDRCGTWPSGPRGNKSTRLPEYDNVVGEESVSWVNCGIGKFAYSERTIVVTHFARAGVMYTVSIRLFNQGFPSDLSELDAIVKTAQDWDAKIQAR